MSNLKKVILLDDPQNQPEDPCMEFRLTYKGALYASQGDARIGQRNRRADNMHDIRKIFHRQLRHLWEITPFLKTGERSGPGALLTEGPDAPDYRISTLARKHSHYGFNFVPLVTRELNLICGLDILFLRPDHPGKVIESGDIDNRLKTLFDSMKIPNATEEYSKKVPEEDEKPMFVLLEDDSLITKISVETDQFLDILDGTKNEVMLVITVRLRPYEMNLGNMQFG